MEFVLVVTTSESHHKPVKYTQNLWVSGHCPSSGILTTRKHNVSETGSVSVLR
jgi:hypothetical protein